MPLDPKQKLDYPLHWAVFTDNRSELESLLKQKTTIEIDKVDARGRTPLLLAVTIGHTECVQLLLQAGADANAHNKQMWSVSNEAVSRMNVNVLRDVIHFRDWQRANAGAREMKNALLKLKNVPDFFCEMNWDFSSWIPFLSQACPSDCHKVYKKGSNVRIDTTLISFEGTNWIRGNQSYIFRLNENGFAEFMVLDHDKKMAMVQELRDDASFDLFAPSSESVAQRLVNPISTTYIDVDQIGFERTSRGFLSWFSGSDKTEKVDGYECKVLNASNVQLVTKKRIEHLSDEDKARLEQDESSTSKAVESIRNMLVMNRTTERTTRDLYNDGITATEYLDAEFEFDADADIGRPREIVKNSNAFKATLWMAEEFPLSLQDQIIPIVEMMAVNSQHFARLHNFIRLQLPSGFPVKIEIPLFHILNARIVFRNINEPGRYVTPKNIQSDFKAAEVEIEDEAFAVPPDYDNMDDGDPRFNITWEDESDRSFRPNRASRSMQSEEMLLQYAIEQSLRDATIHNQADISDEQLARALQYQLDQADRERNQTGQSAQNQPIPQADIEYMNAVRASQIEEDRRREAEMQFEEEMRQVLELSKLDK